MTDRSASRRRILTSVVVACSLAVVAGAGETRHDLPTFASDVEVVKLTVAVTDPGDRPVADLEASDLRVFEDGVPQQISFFTRDRVPISLTLLLDGSSSMGHKLGVAREAAARLIRTLGPEDDAEVVEFTRAYRVLQERTSDQEALQSAVANLQADGETALYSALYIALKQESRREDEADWRQRAVVVLSDGYDNTSLVSEEQILDLARRARLSVYTIGLAEASAIKTHFEGPDPKYFLTSLARETGGRAYFPEALGELDGVYDRIAEELRTSYGVGYVSTNSDRDGSWRKIRIGTVRENLLLRHRLGYHGPEPPRRTRVAAGR